MKMQMRKIMAVIALAVLVTTGIRADTIIQWNFQGNLGFGVDGFQPTENGGQQHPQVTTDGITHGGGYGPFGGTGRASSWGADNFRYADFNSAWNNDQFFCFNVIVEEGYALSLDELNVYLYRSSDGPTDAQWMFSYDGVRWDAIGEPISLPNSASYHSSLDLSGLDETDAIFFRLVIWGENIDPNGRFYFYGPSTSTRKLTITGSVVPTVPEPATAFLASLGVAMLLFRRRRR